MEEFALWFFYGDGTEILIIQSNPPFWGLANQVLGSGLPTVKRDSRLGRFHAWLADFHTTLHTPPLMDCAAFDE